MLPSVNYHLWEPCNMKCKYCFATFQDVKKTILPKGHLSHLDSKEVIYQLVEIGFEKITFAGGEPTLCPWLSDLISTAKSMGMTTMVVTNGTQINNEFLEANINNLDWIALSVDSHKEETNQLIGRITKGNNTSLNNKYYQLCDDINAFGYGLKINTVVNKKNYNESFHELILHAKPKRWKVLQVLPIKGQNDTFIDQFRISNTDFQAFIENHKSLERITNFVYETNDLMKGSYAIVDPAGRFIDNSTGTHKYSKPILQIGARLAIQQVNYSFKKFIDRKGVYQWNL